MTLIYRKTGEQENMVLGRHENKRTCFLEDKRTWFFERQENMRT